MRCSNHRKNLLAYLDGELGPAESKGVAEHLTKCPDCQAAVAGLAVFIKGLKRGEEIVPSAAFNYRLREKLEAERRVGGMVARKAFQPFPLLAGLFLVAGILIGSQLFQQGGFGGEGMIGAGSRLVRELDNFRAVPPDSILAHYQEHLGGIR